MINHLNENGNLMYFIEGTWNLSPNLPMLPCYWGIVDIAKKGNAIIIPVAAEQYGKTFIINIGENFDMNLIEDKSLAINTLRDFLSTLKWEIWESVHSLSRDEIKDDAWDNYVNERFKEWPYFNKEYIDDLIFKPKGVVTNEEAFSHVKRLVPKRENAFLFNKRIKG